MNSEENKSEPADPPTSVPDEPSAKKKPKTLDDLIDEASMDSFPASDPPSYWPRDFS